MGSQQLLLLVVGVIMVGLAVSVAILMFGDSAAASNRDAVANDLTHYAGRAQAYVRRPKPIGGGGGSFVGFSIGSAEVRNANGVFTVSSAKQEAVVIQGLGVEIGYDRSSPVKVEIEVRSDSIAVTELN